MLVEFVQVNGPLNLEHSGQPVGFLVKTEPEADINIDAVKPSTVTVRIYFHGVPGLLKIKIDSYEEFKAFVAQGTKFSL